MRRFLKNCIKGSITSMGIYFILLVVISSLMIVFDISKEVSHVVYRIILFGALIFGGVVTAKANENKGWLSGVLVGTLYFLEVTLFSSIINGEALSFNGVILGFLLYVILGMISGILGVNM